MEERSRERERERRDRESGAMRERDNIFWVGNKMVFLYFKPFVFWTNKLSHDLIKDDKNFFLSITLCFAWKENIIFYKKYKIV